MSKIPTKPEEITKEWLQEVLSVHENPFIVEDFKVSNASEKGDNYSAQVVRIEGKGTKGGEVEDIALFVKIMPPSDMQRNLMAQMKTFVRENEMYNEVFRAIKGSLPPEVHNEIAAPRCYFVQMESGDGVIVLEDLRPKNYTMVDVKKGLDLDHCRVTLKELARFHAMGYRLKYSTKKPLKELFPTVAAAMFTENRSFFEPLYVQFMGAPFDILTSHGYVEKADRLKNKLTEVLPKFFQAFSPLEPYSTICHGDLWGNNMLFRHDEDTGKPLEVKLIDFQVSVYSCPTVDLCYFFCTSTTGELRKSHLEEMLQYYHASLMGYLKEYQVTAISEEDFPFEELWRLYYRHTGYVGLLQGCLMIPGQLMDKEDAIGVDDGSMRDLDSLMEKFKDGAKKSTSQNLVAQRLEQLIDEMMENGVL